MGLTLANKVTVGRIVIVPLFIATVLNYSSTRDDLRYAALAFFLVAVISDVIDGYIARRYYQKTRAGAILDPLADKLIVTNFVIVIFKDDFRASNFASRGIRVDGIIAVGKITSTSIMTAKGVDRD